MAHCKHRIQGCDRAVNPGDVDCWCDCAGCLEARGLGRPLTRKERAEAKQSQYYKRTPHTFFPPAVSPIGTTPTCLLCGMIEGARFVPLEGEPFFIHVKRVKALDAPGMF